MQVECVINVSEGRRRDAIASIAGSAGPVLLDVHTDPDHNRSVLTLGGPLESVEDGARSVTAAAVSAIDLNDHEGVHPRFGAADVVPFVTLSPEVDAISVAVGARDRFARWAAEELALPCFLYGPERSLPEVRRSAFVSVLPDTGPPVPHHTAGATAVGARPVLVAYNVWIAAGGDDGTAGARDEALAAARVVAEGVRGPGVRSLGLAVGPGAQVSLNLTDPTSVPIDGVYDAVADAAEAQGCRVVRAELVGLCPAAALRAVPRRRWAELDLAEDRTIEARLAGANSG